MTVLEEEQYSIAEAKNKLPSIIRHVEGGTAVKLARHGKPVAVLMSIQQYEHLLQKKGGFWKSLTTFRRILEKEGIRISDADFKDLRGASSGREVDWSI